jgi:hypothetical protein
VGIASKLVERTSYINKLHTQGGLSQWRERSNGDAFRSLK